MSYRIPVEETFSWQMPVKEIRIAPPAVPARGDRYIVDVGGTGAWATHDNKIAYCSNATGPVWSFDIPTEGWMCWVKNLDKYYSFDGIVWAEFSSGGVPGPTGPTGPTSVVPGPTGPGVGPGTVNCLAKFTGATAVGDSQVYDNGTSVAIGTTGPNADAIFELASTSQGILIPRMTTLQRAAIATVPEGLIVYDLSLHTLCFYDGSDWVPMGTYL